MMRVYRFGDKVAFNPPIPTDDGGYDGGTMYLSQMQAFELCLALMRAGEDINRVPFSKSSCGTVEIDASGSRYDITGDEVRA